MPKYLAFDIEIAKMLPEDEDDWKAHRPLGISCAAVLPSDTRKPVVFYGVTTAKQPKDRMSQHEAASLVNYLTKMANDGYIILTWNGLGFDFDILAEESGLYNECRRLVVHHIDMMFHAFCELGYGISLDRAAKAMGLPGKTEGMNGALAPRVWADGEKQDVLDYVVQDVRTTLDLALICEQRKHLRWTSQSGNTRTLPLPQGWLTVHQAMALPEPDTSWMPNPWPRKKLLEWILVLDAVVQEQPQCITRSQITVKGYDYEKVKSLYWEARQHHDTAMSKLQEPDDPIPHSYKKPFWMNSNRTCPAGDKEWLERLQKVANKLYEQIASLNPVVEFMTTRGQELYVVASKFMGLQAKRIQEMAVEVQGWSTELKARLDEKLRLADEWQLKADQWEGLLMTESAEEAELRWNEEIFEEEADDGLATLSELAYDAGYDSLDDYWDSTPD